MPDITIDGTPTGLPWTGGTAPTLIIEAAGSFITAEGVPINNGGGPFRKEYATTLDGDDNVVVPDVELPSTEDSSDPSVTYIAYFQKANSYDAQSRTPYAMFGPGRGFRVPESPSTTTWEALDANMGASLPLNSGDRHVGGNLSADGDLSWGGTATGDGSGITNADAGKIKGRTVSGSGPSNGQALAWNSSTSRWEPTSLGSLPAGGNATQIQGRAVSATAPTDGQSLAYNTANAAWEPTTIGPGIFNVRNPPYNATGDGTTNDTSAINAAIAALNAAGGGILYFPFGEYKVTSALTTITVPCIIRGDGAGSAPSAVQWATKITMTSRTAVLFTVTADSALFEGLYLFNSNSTYGVGGAAPATPPTAGAGVKAVASSSSQRVNIVGCVIEGFYDNVWQDGAHWSINRSALINGVRYGLKVINTIAADAGDWTVSDSHFISKTYLQPAMVRIDDAGGGKFANVKMNSYNDLGIPGTTGYTVGISAEYTATSILLLSNVSIENYDEKALDLTHVDLLMLSNVQIGDYYGTNTASSPGILLTDCTDVVLASVMLRTINAPTQIGIVCDSCTRVSQGTIVNDGFLGAFKFTTAYTNDFVPLTLATGWANTGAPFADAAFRYQHGLISLRGMVTYSSGGSTTIATLPAHVRPGQDKVFPAVASGAFQRIRINTDGTIVQEGAGPSGGVVQSLDGICWDHQ